MNSNISVIGASNYHYCSPQPHFYFLKLNIKQKSKCNVHSTGPGSFTMSKEPIGSEYHSTKN